MPAARRRGRPPDPQLAETRRRALVAAASEAFAQQGYAAAGIADIDARLESGHGTFYRHFESKREILDHVVDDAIARLVASVLPDPAALQTGSAEEFLALVDELIGRVFAVVDAEPDVLCLLLLETTSIDEAMTLRLLNAVEGVTGAVAAALEDGVRDGFLRADLDTHAVAAQALYLLVPGLLRTIRGGLQGEDRDRYRRGVVELLARGIAPAA
ncbi:MAG: TetR/AcrR family transcriptional regulator [Baekduiaceae bacterium]